MLIYKRCSPDVEYEKYFYIQPIDLSSALWAPFKL